MNECLFKKLIVKLSEISTFRSTLFSYFINTKKTNIINNFNLNIKKHLSYFQNYQNK